MHERALGGLGVTFSPDRHQGSNRAYRTELRGASITPLR
jgi:hypothetical protein